MAGCSRAAWAIVCVCAIVSPGLAQLAARAAEVVPQHGSASEPRSAAESEGELNHGPFFGPALQAAEPVAPSATVDRAPAPDPDSAPEQRAPETQPPRDAPVQTEAAESRVNPEAQRRDEPAASEALASEPLGLPETPATLPMPDQPGPSGIGAWISKVAPPLLGVLSLAVGAAWLFKKAAGAQGGLAGAIGPGGRAPSGVLEVLGRYPIARGCTLVLLKLDRRVLLLSQSGGGRGGTASFTTLAELDSPEDVASILMKTRAADGEATESRFAEALAGFSSEPPPTLVEVKDINQEPGPAERALARIRARAASLGFGPASEETR